MTLPGKILLIVILLIIVLTLPLSKTKPDPRFPKVWHGLFAILAGFAIAAFGASGIWRGAHHRESDLDTAMFIILGGFGVSFVGFVLLLYRRVRSLWNR